MVLWARATTRSTAAATATTVKVKIERAQLGPRLLLASCQRAVLQLILNLSVDQSLRHLDVRLQANNG